MNTKLAVIDSNSTNSKYLREQLGSGSLDIVIPMSIFFESYKFHDPAIGVERTFGYLQQHMEKVLLTCDFGSSSIMEIDRRKVGKLVNHIDPNLTMKVRAMLKNGIGEFHRNHNDLVRKIIRRQCDLPHGLLNTQNNEIASRSIGQSTLDILPKQLKAKYRNRTPAEWMIAPLDEDLAHAASVVANKETSAYLRKHGFPRDMIGGYVRKNPALFRWIAGSFIRRFVRESGNAIENLPQKEFNNERIDMDFCVFASYSKLAITNDNINTIVLANLHRSMEINQRKLMARIDVVY